MLHGPVSGSGLSWRVAPLSWNTAALIESPEVNRRQIMACMWWLPLGAAFKSDTVAYRTLGLPPWWTHSQRPLPPPLLPNGAVTIHSHLPVRCMVKIVLLALATTSTSVSGDAPLNGMTVLVMLVMLRVVVRVYWTFPPNVLV